MATKPPLPVLFDSSELILLRQGIQKIINECIHHQTQLMVGQQAITGDENLTMICGYYGKRLAAANLLMEKIKSQPELISAKSTQHAG